MTTIATNGLYLLTDKRTTISRSTTSSNRMGFVSEHLSDNTVKIVLPDNLTFTKAGKQHRINAVAFTGSSNTRHEHPSLMVERFKKLEDFLALVRRGSLNGHTGTMVCVLDDGDTLEARLEKEAPSPTYRKKGVPFFVGSGAKMTRFKIVQSLLQKEEVSMRDVFHYCCLNDDGSSFDNYSAYGLEENRLYTTIRTDGDEVMAVWRRISKVIDEQAAKRLARIIKQVPSETKPTPKEPT